MWTWESSETSLSVTECLGRFDNGKNIFLITHFLLLWNKETPVIANCITNSVAQILGFVDTQACLLPLQNIFLFLVSFSEDHYVVQPHVSVDFKQKTKKEAKQQDAVPPKKSSPHKQHWRPQKPTDGPSTRKNNLARYAEGLIPEDTIKILHSIEPLLSQQTKGVMKFHQNDLSPENEKIHDAQKLLEYVKVLQPPRKFKFLNEEISSAKDKKKSTTLASVQKPAKHNNRNKKEDNKSKDREKSKHKANARTIKSKLTKKLKVKGTPLTSLSKTVTFKNHKYKITPVVDWERISKMLGSLGYKAVHIVGVKDKKIHQDITEHLKKHGVDKILGHKGNDKVAAETFVSAVHREKSWHNGTYF